MRTAFDVSAATSWTGGQGTGFRCACSSYRSTNTRSHRSATTRHSRCSQPAAKRSSQLALNGNRRLVAEICRRLDRLPLAIELAAARVKPLPEHALLQRLDKRLKLLAGRRSRPTLRQQTLRAAIDWSYSPTESCRDLRRPSTRRGRSRATLPRQLQSRPKLTGYNTREAASEAAYTQFEWLGGGANC